jgi:hypothetical protein
MRVAREAAIQSNLGESRWRIFKSAPSVFEAKPLQILMRVVPAATRNIRRKCPRL